MATVTLHVKDEILDSLLTILNRFKKDELEVIETSITDSKIVNELQSQYETAITEEQFSIDQLEHHLSTIIDKYES